MIHWKKDIIHQGFNVYPFKSQNLGGLLRIGNNVWSARYSKLSKKWFFDYTDIVKTNLILKEQDKKFNEAFNEAVLKRK